MFIITKFESLINAESVSAVQVMPRGAKDVHSYDVVVMIGADNGLVFETYDNQDDAKKAATYLARLIDYGKHDAVFIGKQHCNKAGMDEVVNVILHSRGH